MRGDDSTDGYNVAIRSFVAIAQSFRLHFHHRQFFSGETLMKLSEI